MMMMVAYHSASVDTGASGQVADTTGTEHITHTSYLFLEPLTTQTWVNHGQMLVHNVCIDNDWKYLVK